MRLRQEAASVHVLVSSVKLCAAAARGLAWLGGAQLSFPPHVSFLNVVREITFAIARLSLRHAEHLRLVRVGQSEW